MDQALNPAGMTSGRCGVGGGVAGVREEVLTSIIDSDSGSHPTYSRQDLINGGVLYEKLCQENGKRKDVD